MCKTITPHKNVVVFDTETTGLDPHCDWIIQLSAQKINKENWEVLEVFDEYVLPPDKNFKIDAVASGVHGITKEFIQENGTPLKETGEKFLEFIKECDISGYNSTLFDLKFLHYNFQKVGLEITMDHKFYDVMVMEARIHPKTLVQVYKNYTGNTMEEDGLLAHNSLGDVIATARVMKEQMNQNNLTWEELDLWEENTLAGPEGSLIWSGDGSKNLIMNVGKYKGKDIFEVMKSDPNYVKWWSQNVASKHSLNVAREYCKACLKKENENA